MNKQEFMERLRAALNGRIAPGLVLDHLNYYEDYINMEIRKGRTEAEVVQMLGDPRLIARTIIETTAGDGREEYQQYHQESAGGEQHHFVKNISMPSWLVAVIVIAVIALILSLIFTVLSFLAPILIPAIVVFFLVKLFRDWLD